METLLSLYPNADDLLALSPEDLAPILLRLGAARRQGGMFWPAGVTQITAGSGMTAENQHAYPNQKQQLVDALVNEGWSACAEMG
jgi:hypothetical protein